MAVRIDVIRVTSPALYRAALAWGTAGVIKGGAHEYAGEPTWTHLWPSKCLECGELPLHPRHLAALRRRSARSAFLQRPRSWQGPENAGPGGGTPVAT